MHKGRMDVTADQIRQNLEQYAKMFKTSWVGLGQSLYAVWKDKLFYSWGFDKFDHYVEKELGIRKVTALKLLKNYFFLEQEEPAYLAQNYTEGRAPRQVPGCEAIDVLRLAKRKKELNEEDYYGLRESVFEKGKEAIGVRKDLTALLRERKPVDPEEDKRQRNQVAIHKFLNAIRSFEKDMTALKIVPAKLVEEANELKGKLEKELD